jgi:hypothetical protein
MQVPLTFPFADALWQRTTANRRRRNHSQGETSALCGPPTCCFRPSALAPCQTVSNSRLKSGLVVVSPVDVTQTPDGRRGPDDGGG